MVDGPQWVTSETEQIQHAAATMRRDLERQIGEAVTGHLQIQIRFLVTRGEFTPEQLRHEELLPNNYKFQAIGTEGVKQGVWSRVSHVLHFRS